MVSLLPKRNQNKCYLTETNYDRKSEYKNHVRYRQTYDQVSHDDFMAMNINHGVFKIAMAILVFENP
jgi:hypothetical protein